MPCIEETPKPRPGTGAALAAVSIEVVKSFMGVCISRKVLHTPMKLRSEEHTSELQSHLNLVCRLLLEKKEHTSELQSHLNLVCRLLLEKKTHTNKLHANSRYYALSCLTYNTRLHNLQQMLH